ncbi:MAG: alginate lyase family protein, partial [Melioribacteraceae bacterium]|nr:alginate lyase family protein [Melioribacteraceae bacterium]
NQNTRNGLPWIYKDGKYNRKSFSETDHKYFYEAMEAIRDLSLAYSLSRNPKYAERAIEITKQWFTDKKTKMNPNLNYAQGIPGKYDGTKSGIIDSRAILWIIQGIELIKPSGLFKADDEKQFKLWCEVYLDWLLTSQFGKDEGKSKNNHGTFYDLQVVAFADYVGTKKIAIEVLDSVKVKRIETQILPDGSQPHELSRTRSHMYSVFNLSAFVELAEFGDKYYINLWNYKTKECGSIKDAVDFLVKNSSQKSNKLFKDKISTKNLLRIIPKVDIKFNGEYHSFLKTELKKEKNVDLTSVYFVN